MKSIVNNRSRLEGSIGEGYITLECLTLCSRYLHNVERKITKGIRSVLHDVLDGSNGGLIIFRTAGKLVGGTFLHDLSNTKWQQCTRYVLNQCEEVKPLIE